MSEKLSSPSRLFISFVAVILAVSVIASAVGPKKDSPADLTVGGAKIHVEFSGEPFGPSRDLILEWVKRCAEAVTAYYGKFPVSHLEIRISSSRGRGVHSGVTYGHPDGGALIKIKAGLASSRHDLDNDWELTHEMVHLAFPTVKRQHHWIEEGLATYIEPWARIFIGNLTPEKVWGDLMRDMPQGLPDEGDQGLDQTPTWGRTYWGGALFALLADVKIHEKTKNKKGLIDALRAINEKMSISSDGNLLTVLRIGDEATGTSVLQDLYNEMKDKPVNIDLDNLWKKLGIKYQNGRTVFDNSAPGASTRRAIEKKPAHP